MGTASRITQFAHSLVLLLRCQGLAAAPFLSVELNVHRGSFMFKVLGASITYDV